MPLNIYECCFELEDQDLTELVTAENEDRAEDYICGKYGEVRTFIYVELVGPA